MARHNPVRKTGSRKLWKRRQRNLAWPDSLGRGHGPDEELIAPLPSHENISFQFRGEFFNLFNHPQWADPNVTLANSTFGSTRATIGTNADYRIIQLALKMFF